MNKKITFQRIKVLALQMALIIVAVTAVGGAAIMHDEFKSTADKDKSSVSEKADVSNTAVNKNTPAAQTAPENSNYEYAYAGFNPRVTEIGKDVSRILVNSSYRLPDNYSPSLSEAVKGSGVMLDSRAAPYYQAMYDAAKNDGYTLTPVSGYRTVEQQKKNFELRIQNFMEEEGLEKKEATIKASEIILLPGTSEHNAGLAMDICSLSESFENTDEFEWLSEHAADYGFILRYPKDEAKQKITKITYEPWHYRYVGIKAAQEITKKGITLEEYLKLA